VGAALLIALLVGLAGLMQPHAQVGALEESTQTATVSPAGTRTVVPTSATGLFNPPTAGAILPAARELGVRWVAAVQADRPPAPGTFPTPVAPPARAFGADDH
jgi:hypothetical protein